MNDDLISRSALRKKVNSFFDSQFEGIVSSDLIKYAEAVDDFIDNAPTIEINIYDDISEVTDYSAYPVSEPERPKGKWITKPHVHGVTYCSECDFELKIDDTNYCPNCGARMER